MHKKSLSFCSLSCHAVMVTSDSVFLPSCLRQFWSKPSTTESTVGELVKGHCGSLITRGDEHSVRLHNLANTVIGRGHGRWCPVYDESEQVLQVTTEVTRQQCCVSFGWQPTNVLMSPVDLWQQDPNELWMRLRLPG